MTKANLYEEAKNIYAGIGVDTDAAIERLKEIKISVHCWQGDDVKGFLSADQPLSGGISVTGNYPGAARNADELRNDMEAAFKCIPGKHKINLHAIYAEAQKGTGLDELEPEHFKNWMDWADENNLGLDFNPTCFSHPLSKDGFTLSHSDNEIRKFWIRHCNACRRIGESLGRRLNQKAVVNIWIPDGYKDVPVDRVAPRARLKDSLDEIFKEELNSEYLLDTLESKLFGIGSESYVVGSHEFYMGYALKNSKAVCMDTGHFHPTETVSNKISALSLFFDEMLLHVSRPVRWDSDHVVMLDDELQEIAFELVRNDLLDRVYIGLDYFDASINRAAAWVIGARNMLKSLLRAMLEPSELLKKYELEGDYTSRLAMLEEMKSFPYSIVWDHYCEVMNAPVRDAWLGKIKEYERNILSKRV